MLWVQRFIATGAFSGYSPVAPGTVGTVLFLLAFLLIPGLEGISLVITVALLLFVGVWAAAGVEKTDGHDAQIINIDEMAGMGISLMGFPTGLAWYWVILPFLLFRLFDVTKPYPVNRAQDLPGGWGVMMDDILAGVYAWIVFHFCYHIFLKGLLA